MALTFLVDTSALKRLEHPEVRSFIQPLAIRGELGRPSICDLEVGDSARSAEEWDRLVGALEALSPIQTTAAHVRRALQVQRLLADRSQRGRKMPHLLVAAAGEELSVSVLHYHSDFDLISSVTAQKSRWVVPAGSLD